MVRLEVGMQDMIRNTLEYHEAHVLLWTKAALRTELARVNTELKQLRGLSAASVRLARLDAQDVSLNVTNRVPTLGEKNERSGVIVRRPRVFRTEPTTQQPDAGLARFLAEMERRVSWEKLEALLEPSYNKGTWRAQGIDVSSMVRLYFLLEWCSLSDKDLISRIQSCPTTRAFLCIASHKLLLGPETFRRIKFLLEKSGLDEAFSQIVMDGLAFKEASEPLDISQ